MSGRRPRIALAASALSLAALAGLPSVASADLLAPDSPASSQADAGRLAYIVMVVLTLIAALVVIGLILRAARSRRREGAEQAPRRTRGTAAAQRRVGGALAIAAIVLFVFGIFVTENARDVEASETDAEPITIQVDGQQWVWRYEYPSPEETSDGYSPDAPFSYYDLYVPVDTPITLQVSSIDVQHRWWVPALAPAADAIPGEEAEVNFTADEVGTYHGASTEFSGQGYATMRTAVHVLEQDEYEQLLGERLDQINEAREAVQDEVEAGTAPGVALQQGAGGETSEAGGSGQEAGE